MRRNSENGQAVLLVVVALGLVLAGAAGLAIDSGQLYGHMQMAQPTADSAAMAAAMSIYGKTNVGANSFDSTSGAFTCTNGTDVRTPCAYARSNGFGLTGSSDIVAVKFPASVPGVTLSSTFLTNAVQVDVTRSVPMTFMRLLGTASTKIHTQAIAGIVQVVSPVPIVVLDPAGSPSFSLSGNPNIKICGGPQRSIQVNSSAAGALNFNGTKATVDLSHAGPADNGVCGTGTGGDFAVWGGPITTPSALTPFGSTEHYDQPAAALPDPLASVNPPSKPANTKAQTTVNFGSSADCPATLPTDPILKLPGSIKNCTVYYPGYYSSFAAVSGQYAIFQPGLYYIDGGTFGNGANGFMAMCSAICVADTTGSNCCSSNGMLAYLTKNVSGVKVGANSNATLTGSDLTGTYLGMLLFIARDAKDIGPNLGGGGNLTLTGTLYMPTQTLSVSGNSGSSTTLKGEIIVNDLTLGGGGTITMDLNSDLKLTINQVALVK